MKNLILILIIVSLLTFGNNLFAGEILKIGSKVKAGYSKESFDCEVIAFYGNMVTLKSTESNKQKIFHIFSEKIGEGYFTPDAKIPKGDENFNEDVLLDMMIEGCHPNGEWYVGKVVEKYGKFLRLQLGGQDWSSIWVNETQYSKSMLIEKEIKFMDYRHRQIGILGKDGVLKNKKGESIARVYSNGKVFDSSGEAIGKINQDGSIEINNKVIIKTNTQFNNGLEYLDVDNNPILVIRIKSASMYQPNRPDIVNVFFEENQLKGNMRVCGGLFFLVKNKF